MRVDATTMDGVLGLLSSDVIRELGVTLGLTQSKLLPRLDLTKLLVELAMRTSNDLRVAHQLEQRRHLEMIRAAASAAKATPAPEMAVADHPGRASTAEASTVPHVPPQSSSGHSALPHVPSAATMDRPSSAPPRDPTGSVRDGAKGSGKGERGKGRAGKAGVATPVAATKATPRASTPPQVSGTREFRLVTSPSAAPRRWARSRFSPLPLGVFDRLYPCRLCDQRRLIKHEPSVSDTFVRGSNSILS